MWQEFEIAGPCAWVWGGFEFTRPAPDPCDETVDWKRDQRKDHFLVNIPPAIVDAIHDLEVSARGLKRPSADYDTCAEHLAYVEMKMSGKPWVPTPSLVKYDDDQPVLRLQLEKIQGRPPRREWLDDTVPVHLTCVLVYDGKSDLDYYYKELKLKPISRTPLEPGDCPYCCHGVGEAEDCTCGESGDES